MTIPDVYDTLTERLGFPGSKLLRAALEETLNPTEAKLVETLPGTVAEVAAKTSVPESEAKKVLDELYFRGMVVPTDSLDSRNAYRFHGRAVDVMDSVFINPRLDPNQGQTFGRKWQGFWKNEGELSFAAWLGGKEPRARIVPAYGAIKDLIGILPQENFHELLKTQELISVQRCACRMRADLSGDKCTHTRETETNHCLSFGPSAELFIHQGVGKRLTLSEAITLSEVIEKEGLVHRWVFRADASPSGMQHSGQCCTDCRIFQALVRGGLDFTSEWQKSRYEAYVTDLDACDGCQICVERCHFDAIQMDKIPGSKRLKAAVDPEKCMGCGVCVIGCGQEAIKMQVVRPPEWIPGVPAGSSI